MEAPGRRVISDYQEAATTTRIMFLPSRQLRRAYTSIADLEGGPQRSMSSPFDKADAGLSAFVTEQHVASRVFTHVAWTEDQIAIVSLVPAVQ